MSPKLLNSSLNQDIKSIRRNQVPTLWSLTTLNQHVKTWVCIVLPRRIPGSCEGLHPQEPQSLKPLVRRRKGREWLAIEQELLRFVAEYLAALNREISLFVSNLMKMPPQNSSPNLSYIQNRNTFAFSLLMALNETHKCGQEETLNTPFRIRNLDMFFVCF